MSKKRLTFNKHRQMALNSLEKNPETRNSDWELLFQTLFDKDVFIPTELRNKIKNSGINFHTLVRERARIQNTYGLFKAKPEVEKRRMKLKEEYTEYYGDVKP